MFLCLLTVFPFAPTHSALRLVFVCWPTINVKPRIPSSKLYLLFSCSFSLPWIFECCSTSCVVVWGNLSESIIKCTSLMMNECFYCCCCLLLICRFSCFKLPSQTSRFVLFWMSSGSCQFDLNYGTIETPKMCSRWFPLELTKYLSSSCICFYNVFFCATDSTLLSSLLLPVFTI